MENQPKKNLQMRFQEKNSNIEVGDFLTYKAEDGGYFTNRAGFRINFIPNGIRFETVGYENKEYYNPKIARIIFTKTKYTKLHFSDGEVIKISSLPEK